MLNEQLLELALEALAKHKVDINNTKTLVKTLEAVIKKDKATNIKVKDTFDEKLKLLDTSIQTIVKEEIAKLPKPKDGIDGKSIKGPPGKDGKSIRGLPGKDGISIQGKPGKDGKDGKSIKGEPGKDGKDGVGKPGSDGIGIKDITGNANAITIELTNGKEKVIKLPKVKTTGNGGGFTSGTPANNSVTLLTDTVIQYPSSGDVLTFQDGKWINSTPTGGVVDIDNFKRRTEIETMFKTANATTYKELIYDNENITSINIYTDNEKTVKLFTKIIGYNVDNNIDTISTIDEVNSDAIYKTIGYTGSNLTSVTSTYIKA